MFSHNLLLILLPLVERIAWWGLVVALSIEIYKVLNSLMPSRTPQPLEKEVVQPNFGQPLVVEPRYDQPLRLPLALGGPPPPSSTDAFLDWPSPSSSSSSSPWIMSSPSGRREREVRVRKVKRAQIRHTLTPASAAMRVAISELDQTQ